MRPLLVRDCRCPVGDRRPSSIPGGEPGVLISPHPDIDQILLARQDRALADLFPRNGPVLLLQELSGELAHDPGRDLVSLSGIDEAEHHEMDQ